MITFFALKSFLALYNILPFGLLLLFNTFLLKNVIENRNKILTGQNRKLQRMGITIISISFLFMIFSLPTASIQGQTLSYLFSFDLGQLIVLICNAFAYTFQASNLIMLSFTNKKFMREFGKTCGFIKTGKKLNQSTSNTRY